MEGTFGGKIYQFSKWISNLLLINLYWSLFMVLGLILFGIFPATIAMFTVVRNWVQYGYDIPIFHTMWSTYRREFIKSNIIGFILFVIGLILYMDLNYLTSTNSSILNALIVPNIIIVTLFLLSLLYLFPVYVHFDIGISKVLKNSMILVVIKPFSTITLVFLFMSFIFATYQLPYFILLSFSIYSLLAMKLCYKQFEKMV